MRAPFFLLSLSIKALSVMETHERTKANFSSSPAFEGKEAASATRLAAQTDGTKGRKSADVSVVGKKRKMKAK